MVNVVKEPHQTPARPRVSSSASTSLTISQLGTNGKSRIPRLAVTSTMKKRAPLGEMPDNVSIASAQEFIKARAPMSKAAGQLSLKPRVTPAVVIKGAPKPRSFPSVTFSPITVETRAATGQEQLLDTTITDMPELSETDASDTEDPNAGLRRLLSRKGVGQNESPRWPLPQRSKSSADPTSHLPTPPPSQTNSLATPPRSSLSQRRPRPSITPPRQTLSNASSSASTLLSPAVITEPSPNPRRKKTPRTTPDGSEDSQATPQSTLRKGKGRPRKSRPSASSCQQDPNESTTSKATAATFSENRRPRKSRSQKSSTSPNASTPKHTPRSGRGSSAGLSGDLSKAARSLTPAGKKLVQAGGSTLLRKALRATPGEDPLLLGGWDAVGMRKRPAVSAETDPLEREPEESEDEEEQPPPIRDKGKGRAIVFPSPPSSQDVSITSLVRPALPKHPEMHTSGSLSRFIAHLPDPHINDPMDFGYDGSNDPGFASASDDEDASNVGNDTFCHVRVRQKQLDSTAASAKVVDSGLEDPTQCSGASRETAARQMVLVDQERTLEELKVSLDATHTTFIDQDNAKDLLDKSRDVPADDIASAPVELLDKVIGMGERETVSTSAVDGGFSDTVRSSELLASSTQVTTRPSAVTLPAANTFSSPQPSSPISPNTSNYLDYVTPLAGGEETEEEEEQQHEQEDEKEGSSDPEAAAVDGDVTIEGISENWDISVDTMAQSADSESESRPGDTLLDTENDLHASILMDSAEHATADTAACPSDESSEEEEEPLEDTAIEASEKSIDDVPPAPPPEPERIVLKIVPRGVVKVEPELPTAGEAPSLPKTNPLKAEEQSNKNLSTSPDPGASTPLLESTPGLGALTATTPPSVLPSTPLKAAGPTPTISTTPTTSPPIRAKMGGDLEPSKGETVASKIERMPIRTVTSKIPSKLSQQWLAQSPDRSENDNRSTIEGRLSPAEQPAPTLLDDAEVGIDSIRITEARPEFLHELQAVDGDRSLTAAVEISSMDPRAAARAAAILKMNHAYIEHGQSSNRPATPRHARRSSLHQSQHLASIEASRQITKEELLHEAELEIVHSNRDRRRSLSVVSPASGVTALTQKSSLTDVAIPGGWVNSPKRKREHDHAPGASRLNSEMSRSHTSGANGWTIRDWRKLEKSFISEKKAWVQEREVKQMPGGFTSWATRSFRGPAAAKEWDPERVVTRFLAEEGAENAGGDWARDLIALRVGALERRVADKISVSSTDDLARQAPSPKKSRTDVPLTPGAKADNAAPQTPSTLSRVFDFMWSPWSSLKTSNVATATVTGRKIEPDSNSRPIPVNLDGSVRDKGKFKMTEQSMRKTPGRTGPTSSHIEIASTSRVATASASHALPDSSTSSARLPVDSSACRIRRWTAGLPSMTPSSLATSSSPAIAPVVHSSTPRIYPALPSITQRSAALKALFPTIHPLNDSTSSTASAGSAISSSSTRSQPVSIPKRSNSLQNLVKSFEEAKTLEKALERREGSLRRSQSGSSLRSAQ